MESGFRAHHANADDDFYEGMQIIAGQVAQ